MQFLSGISGSRMVNPCPVLVNAYTPPHWFGIALSCTVILPGTLPAAITASDNSVPGAPYPAVVLISFSAEYSACTLLISAALSLASNAMTIRAPAPSSRTIRIPTTIIISLEMMIVVGILIVLLIGAGARIVIALLANDNAAEMSNVQALYSALKDIKTTAGYGAPGTELSEAVIAAGSVPGNMTVHDNAIQNQWGGVYALTSTGQGFTIRDPDIPDKNCIKIALAQSQAGQFSSTAINGGAEMSGALSAADTVSACAEKRNTIAWTSSN